jgi:5'-methylthioadenosine phosphorylase
MDNTAEIGILGGSGLYSLLDKSEEIKVDTPYGPPSDRVALCKIGGLRVAFIPRHGKHHQHPPHKIPYKANLWALKELGVKRLIAPCVVGSLQPQIKLGDFVICDQFIDRTTGRKSTFYDGHITVHVSTADPYCPELRKLAIKASKKLGITTHEKGTVVVIEGPRFSTRAESQWYKSFGWEVINMTQYPEVTLARELELCYVNISLVTDYDVWQQNPVTHSEVIKFLAKNVENVKHLIKTLIPEIPKKRHCICGQALKETKL